MTGEVRSLTTADWIATQITQLLAQRGHAWLLHGPSGLGQYDLALSLASAFLCERVTAQGACGSCASCHAIEVRTHADLCILMPEVILLELGWPLSEKAQSEIDDKKRKASREIRVDDMRQAIEFSQRTSARGRGKVVLVYPAEQMNPIAANALLKTLEEPAGDVKFVLASESAHQLLPTIRSRCLGHTMLWPDSPQSLAWLQKQGITLNDAQSLLPAAGGRPHAAMALFRSGRDPNVWAQVPAALTRGDPSFFKDWLVSDLVETLQMLCHDAMAHVVGAAPRYFDARGLDSRVDLVSLTAWSRTLTRVRRTMEHPYQTGLMHEALVAQAKTALNSKP